MSRLYLYGVIEARDGAVLAGPGLDGLSPVRTVVQAGLGCVVSAYSGEEFGAMPQEKLVRSVLAHQQVVERVVQQQAVLPAKFGTLLAGPPEALSLLSQGCADFTAALAAIRDKVEVEVAATWDTGRVLQEIATEEEMVRAREALTRKGPPTLEDRVRLGQLVKAHLDRRRDSYRARMVDYLRPFAVAVSPNTILSDEMVMNVAFLVDRAQQQGFDEAVTRLDELFQREIAFRAIGPLPPYSFATIEIARLAREDVEQAQRALGLGDDPSEPAVRKAYRLLAAQEQRNPRPECEQAGLQLAQLRRASELLLSYGRARDRAGANGGRPDVACLFAIAIRGLRGDEIEPARFGASAGAQRGTWNS